MQENEFLPFTTLLEDLSDEEQERSDDADDRSKFGISFLDDATGGIRRNDFISIASKSGMGKTELATNIAMQNALEGKNVLYFALEAAPREISRRIKYKILSKEFYNDPDRDKSKRPYYRFWLDHKQEDFLKKYNSRVIDYLQKYNNLKIQYKKKNFTFEEVKKAFVCYKNNIDLFVIDHLHYMDIDQENENKAYKETVKGINDLIAEYGIPVILVVHMRKTDKRLKSLIPDVEDIHGSSDIFKIVTQAITIAPAYDVQNDGIRLPTYMRVNKLRVDGSVHRFCALINYDISKNRYEENYTLGQLTDLDSKFEQVFNDKLPVWAERAFSNQAPAPIEIKKTKLEYKPQKPFYEKDND